MAFSPDLSVAIILVNWNGFNFTKACLQSLRNLDYSDFKIFVVDNASENDESARLKEEFPEIIVLQNESNLGFAGGNNAGIRKALEEGFSQVLLLNNDTIVKPDFLEEMMIRFKSDPSIGVVQPAIFFIENKDQIWSAGGKWNSFLGRAITLGDRKYKAEFSFEDKSLDWATGCCLLISREALLEAGLLDESYFAYFEDVEWSLRFREKGFKIELASKAIIFHEGGASSKLNYSEGTLSPHVFYYHVRNQLFLLRKEITGLKIPFAFGYHLTRFVLWMGYFCFRGRFQKLRAVLKGIRDGFSRPLQTPPAWP